jgi:DNA-directed RNA polymerase I, II, and III subunit RPABC5
MTEELPPIRCVTCNKVLASKWKDYERMLSEGIPIEQILNKLGLTRPCCRLRLRNPIKVVEKLPHHMTNFEDNFDTLSISLDSEVSEVPSTGALSALKNVTSMTIVPEEEETGIILAPLPPLPSISSKKTTPQVVRTYTAW